MEPMLAAKLFACALLGYAIGNLTPSFLFAKRAGFDARVAGSGNVGAANAYLLAGKGAFAFSAIFDILKAFASYKFAALIVPNMVIAGPIGGVACIFGHMFPAVLKFKGGKGLACTGGVILAWSPLALLVLFCVALVILFTTRYLCFVAPSISVIWPASYIAITGDWASGLIFLIPAIPIIAKHTPNFKRVLDGTEVKIDYLWNKEKELERTNRDEMGIIKDTPKE